MFQRNFNPSNPHVPTIHRHLPTRSDQIRFGQNALKVSSPRSLVCASLTSPQYSGGKLYLGVSKNRKTPKWMVYNGKPYQQMDDLGVPLFFQTPIYIILEASIISNSPTSTLLEVQPSCKPAKKARNCLAPQH